MAKLVPYLFSRDARRQAAFYAEALRGEIVSVQTFGDAPHSDPAMKDKVMHLVLEAAGVRLYMADGGNGEFGGIDITLEFAAEEEARAAFEGLSAGGSVLMPLQRMFWGSMFGRLQDPFGVRWQIAAQPVEGGEA